MSHFSVAVIVKETEIPNVEETVTRLLAPYDENIRVEEYLELCQHCEGAGTVLSYGEERTCELCEGTGHLVSTYSPLSKWDWWVIGGRWHNPDGDTYRVSQYKDIPFAIVTPDGQWHQQGEMGWFGISHDDDPDWPEKAGEILRRYQNYFLVIVDCHI